MLIYLLRIRVNCFVGKENGKIRWIDKFSFDLVELFVECFLILGLCI